MSYNRKNFKLLVILWVSTINSLTAQIEKPNIVFFLVDDLGWNDLGCYGSKYYATPNIDKLADGGMMFTAAYMMPTCSPSRASLMTGKYPPRTGIYTVDAYSSTPLEFQKVKGMKSKKYLVPNDMTIAEVLKNVGYTTGHFGKWHLGDMPKTYPKAQGFDVNVGGSEAGSPKSFFSPFHNIKNIGENENGKYLTEVLTDEACKFIDENKEKSFFLYFPFYQVHVPVHAKMEWVGKYVDKVPFKEQNNPNYGAMVSYMDYSVGRIMDKLADLGLQENTIVVLTSDNGGQIMVTSNAPLKGQKGNLSEGGIRVPLIVKWPGKIEPATKCDEPVTVVDYFPTLAEIGGADISSYKDIDGESFMPLLKGEKHLNRKAIFWHLTSYNGNGRSNSMLWQPPGGAIRKGDWKLIENFEDGRVQLYNLKKDIGEKTDLSQINLRKKSELLKDLKAWQNQINAPIPSEYNPNYKKESRDWINKSNNRNTEEAKRLTLIKQ